MTIIEGSEKMLGWFTNNNYFTMKDLPEIFPDIVDIPESDKACILCALAELEKSNIIKSIDIGKIKYYILVKSLNLFEQNVQISYTTSSALCEIARQAAEKFKSKDLLIDPLNITEKDILTVLTVLIESIKRNDTNEQQ